MTLNNFEKQAKERLSKREIQPTNRAWKEISVALEEKNSALKPGYFWYGIAAGFVGILIVSVLYFKPTTAVVKESQIVNNPVNSSKKEQKQSQEQQNILIPNEKIKRKEAIVAGQHEEVKNGRLQKPQKSNAIASVSPGVEKDLSPKIAATHSEEIINSKLEEVFAKVNLLETNKSTLTDMEVDSLLRQAQKEILTERLFREDMTVDATALLSEVEDELDHSFRDQIFEKLKTGFNKVRTAVADRNN